MLRLPSIAPAFLVAAALVTLLPRPGAAQDESRDFTLPPDDFAFQYRSNSGPLPPSAQWEYVVDIGPEGGASMHFESGSGETWTREFEISQDYMRGLWKVMFEWDVIGREWEPATEDAVGGGSSSMHFAAFGHEAATTHALEDADDRKIYGDLEILTHILMTDPVFGALPGVVQARFVSYRP